MTTRVSSLATPFADRSVVTIGAFDGVHRGHQVLLDRAMTRARELQCPLVIVTFEPIPTSVLRPERYTGRICSVEEKLALLAGTGADVIAVLAFDRALASLTAEEFIEQLRAGSGMIELWVGEAFALGRNRSGDIARLRELGELHGFGLVAMSRLEDGGGVISSSRVRQAIIDGDVRTASVLLGRPLTVRGEVVQGQQLGRTIGYPTANVTPPSDLVPIADGIYASRTRLPGEQESRPSMTYVGTRPTVNTGARAIETHLFDFDGDLYGQVIEVEVLNRLRPDAQFTSIDELVEQLRRDEQDARRYLGVEETPVD